MPILYCDINPNDRLFPLQKKVIKLEANNFQKQTAINFLRTEIGTIEISLEDQQDIIDLDEIDIAENFDGAIDMDIGPPAAAAEIGPPGIAAEIVQAATAAGFGPPTAVAEIVPTATAGEIVQPATAAEIDLPGTAAEIVQLATAAEINRPATAAEYEKSYTGAGIVGQSSMEINGDASGSNTNAITMESSQVLSANMHGRKDALAGDHFFLQNVRKKYQC